MQKIREDTENFLGEIVDRAIITVPAYFNDNQRQATKDAGKIAGFEVVRIINEPTGASLAYGFYKGEKDLKIMIFDLGGGTLDVTIMHIREDGVFQVKSTSGDTHLGGTDMDSSLVSYIVDEFRKQSTVDIRSDKAAMMRIREAAEKAKIELSYDTSTEIILPYLAYSHPTGPINLVLPITRQDLEKVVSPIIERCRSPMMQAINDAKLNPGDVDKIILIGGPTRMPIITQFVRNVVGKEPEKGIDPMEAVAKGAAIQGALLAGEIVDDIQLMDVTPLTLGVEILGEKIEPLIEKNTTVPTRKSRVFTTANDYQTSVTIHIVQGEGENASDCASLGMFTLSGIPPTLKGVPQVEVSFQYDINGILDVTAKDLATSKKANITISTEAKLSEEEVEKLRKDSNYKRKGKENLEISCEERTGPA